MSSKVAFMASYFDISSVLVFLLTVFSMIIFMALRTSDAHCLFFILIINGGTSIGIYIFSFTLSTSFHKLLKSWKTSKKFTTIPTASIC